MTVVNADIASAPTRRLTGRMLWLAALLGGIDNPWGAPIGGFMVGVLVNLAGAYVVGSHLQQALALLVIVVVLVFKPSGLFGRTVVVRV